MEVHADRFAIVQPYTDRPDRLAAAIVVSTHGSAWEAFAVLDRLIERLQKFDIPGDAIEMLVVDSDRRPVKCGH